MAPGPHDCSLPQWPAQIITQELHDAIESLWAINTLLNILSKNRAWMVLQRVLYLLALLSGVEFLLLRGNYDVIHCPVD